MEIMPLLRAILLGLTLLATGCKQYSTVSRIRPAYHSPTPAGHLIATELKHPASQPLVRMGRYLDAAAAASAMLRENPGHTTARRDYNFAVSRLFGVIQDAKLEPWKSPLPCPGARGIWSFSIKADPRPERNPANFDIEPADLYEFKGTLVAQRTLKDGLGAPLIVISRNIHPEKIDAFAQGKHIFYGMAGVVDFTGRHCVATIHDPLSSETVTVDGHSYPLAADFSAPLALALADQKPRSKELDGLFRPDDFAASTRLARLQPYDPKKIPVLCIHGLGDSQATWAPMIQALRGDPTIRKNYQFWFFSYQSGYPYPLMASVLRRQMDAINAHYPGHKKIVVIGHSMGGMIARTLLTDSGMKLWNAIYDQPPGRMPFSPETRKLMTESLIFKHRPEIARVIFASPSHQGADLATTFWGRLGSKLIGSPDDLARQDPAVLAMTKPGSTGEHLQRMPNSIDFLNPENRFVTNLAKLPLAKGIPYHSILGDRGQGGNLNHTEPVSTDGIVPYWSSHLDGAESEIIIPSHHWTNQHPLGIAEVRRILLLHLRKP